MRKISSVGVAVAVAFGTVWAESAHAGIITLDFESAATGLNIISAPLVTPDGTITASASGGSFMLFSDFPNTGHTGNFLYLESMADDYAQLAFDFDVSSITFEWSGRTFGVFTAQALDAGLNVVASLFDPDTGDNLPGGPTTFLAPNIRYLRFGDYPGGLANASIDNVTIEAAVPEPGTMLLLGGGLVGLAARRRRRS